MRYRIFAVLRFGLFDTIIRFYAHPLDAAGEPIERLTATIAADHRPARDIRWALANGEQPEVEVPGYMVLDTRETVKPGSQPDWPVDHEEGE